VKNDPTRRLARALALLSLGAGGLAYIRVRSRSLDPSILLYAGKLFSQTFAPILGLLGAAGGFLGALKRDGLALAGGGLGALLLSGYLRGVSMARAGFGRAFGTGWQHKIPPERAARLSRRRWGLFLPPAPKARLHANLPFWRIPDSGRRLLCDVWQPAPGTPPSGLGLIYAHGGGWQNLDKDTGTRPLFRRLADQGHVIMDISYRMCQETDTFGMAGDVKRAIAWLKAHGPAYGVDPGHIVLAGASAGAHLSLLAAYTPNDARLDPADVRGADTSVRGVISSYGPANLVRFASLPNLPDWPAFVRVGRALGFVTARPYLNWPEVECRLLGGPSCGMPATAALFSPLAHVGPHCPPTLLVHGAHDRVVSVEDSRELSRALAAHGVPVVYLELPLVDHAFDLPLLPISPAAQAALYVVERFLALLATEVVAAT